MEPCRSLGRLSIKRLGRKLRGAKVTRR